MGQKIGKINGTEIDSVSVYHENLYVRTTDGNHYFLNPKEVLVMMNEFIFEAELKRTRTWLHPVSPDVDLLYHQENYPNET